LTYEHHIGKDLYLNFELYYSYPLNSNLNDYTWEASKIGTNISLNYAFDFEHENIPPIIIKEPEKVEESIVDASPIPKNESPEMELTPGTLNILETVVTQTYPLLPYLFFDSLSYVLDEKYLKNNSIDFDEKNVPKEALSIYYSLLNIIGDRLKKAKDSKIQVIGMTDGKELPELSQRLELATKRAENVKKYLVNSFNLSPHQIEISAKDVPEMLTSISHKEGNEENRRVEITTENYEILKPLIHSRFNENELINKEIVVLLQNQDKFIDWKLELVSNSSIIASISGGKPDNNLVKIEITDYIREKILDAIQKNLSLKIKITTNSKDNTFTKEYDVIIYKEKNKFELGRLNLIVFDYDKYEINKINQDIIAKFVAGSINDNSKVKIVGSTDKLGEKLYNQKLSEDRANEVYKYLKKIKPSTNYTEIKGIGFSKLPYDNQLSEGRFYCRTVLIEVTSPIK